MSNPQAGPTAADPFGILGGAIDPAALSALVAQQMGLGDARDAPVVAAEAKRASAAARPGDKCPECVCPLVVREISYECPECHAVFEAADIQDVLPVSNPENPGAGALRGRLRVVGPEAGWFQPDLDRTNPGESSEAQKKSTYQELLRYNREFESRGGNPFPLDVLQDVAENYHIIQQVSVKRSETKKYILAALVFHTCISRGFTRNRADAAELLQLRSHGIARGDDYLRSVDEDRGLEIDMNCDRLGPHITSTFSYLDLTDEGYAPLHEAVAGIVNIAEGKHIGFQSILRSKVVATTYEVLRRKGVPVTVEDVATKCKIRKHTIRHFLDELADFHSHFEEEYRRHGLDSASPLAGPASDTGAASTDAGTTAV